MSTIELDWIVWGFRNDEITSGMAQIAEYETATRYYSALVAESVKRPGSWLLSMTDHTPLYYASEDDAKAAAVEYFSTL
ncbi:hypothetical protein BN970_01342 [Mycolicibacterium conceptionense]|uniref:Uncharacterized protein n=1 Tax=Mycolicibacterium conceptionense TaxID=451644 RepID=A0A0U1D319_9MYCO|nr:hypothetical protein [Mycolicibacterium conceptionense]ORV20945.1 hypothetical protein AWB98_01205 [Mycolicibacterium conceptionense]CQD07157.1 hypothetical protein BN970_01342 [Mycolicibacterium conceptionense]